ncbi:hypothetical protein D5H75_33440 [Bailinhaonella thermotolerans]|uniref:Uncharacterized protein n=1 Tax=Bailinhaonella thermotolerans TaxID=1070861 RepID=A0A3A4A5X5_9ACTN|nr:hypothetical protein D5H75_33440 [Bailinhaonella thermotolerans]
MTRSPAAMTARSGAHSQVASSVSPLPWRRTKRSPPTRSSRVSRKVMSGQRKSAGSAGQALPSSLGRWKLIRALSPADFM